MASSRGKAFSALKERIAKLEDTDILFRQMWDYQLDPEPGQSADRACILVLAAALEQSLETAILTHLSPMTSAERRAFFSGGDDEGPFAFAIKIRLAYGLGVFGPASRDDLTAIRHIRNAAAHAKGVISFSDTEIRAAISLLTFQDRSSWGGVLGEKPDTPKRLFIEAVRHYYAYFESAFRDDKATPLRVKDFDLSFLYA